MNDLLADDKHDTRDWRELERERMATLVAQGVEFRTWTCTHRYAEPDHDERSHLPLTNNQRFFGTIVAIDYDDRHRQRDAHGRWAS